MSLSRDVLWKRYKAGESITVTEFIYPILQAYDSVVLSSDIELGGTDQRFNILNEEGISGELKRVEFVGPQVGEELRLWHNGVRYCW